MAKNYIQSGDRLTLTAPYDVASGAGALVGNIFGVALNTALSGASNEFAVEGVWELTKVTAETWAQGDLAYWDNTAKKVTQVAYGNTLIGTVTEAAGNTATTGRVNLTEGATKASVELDVTVVNAYMADAGTAGSVFVPCPAGKILQIDAVSSVANLTTATVFTPKIAGAAVTTPAFTFTTTQAAGVVSSTVPTAANVLTDAQALEIASDGGSASVMPTMFTIRIARSK